MNDSHETQVKQQHSDRRRFLSCLGATAVAGSAGGGLGPRLAYACTLSKAQRDRMTQDQIIALMKQGNERFRKGERPTPNYIAQQRATANDQHPLAVILSCIDSRA